MQYTEKLSLKKLELTDSPPDITELNGNWDKIDKTLDEHEKKIETASYVVDQDGQKYRWGIDEKGVFLEEVEEV